MDLKYHSFIRSLSGAYVTLGNNPQLTLEKYQNLLNLEVAKDNEFENNRIIGI